MHAAVKAAEVGLCIDSAEDGATISIVSRTRHLPWFDSSALSGEEGRCLLRASAFAFARLLTLGVEAMLLMPLQVPAPGTGLEL